LQESLIFLISDRKKPRFSASSDYKKRLIFIRGAAARVLISPVFQVQKPKASAGYQTGGAVRRAAFGKQLKIDKWNAAQQSRHSTSPFIGPATRGRTRRTV
jgi:hypothetical protein